MQYMREKRVKSPEQIESESERKIFRTQFALKLKKARQKQKITQEHAATLAKINEDYYGHLEVGRYMPTLFIAKKLAKALHVSLDALTNF